MAFNEVTELFKLQRITYLESHIQEVIEHRRSFVSSKV